MNAVHCGARLLFRVEPLPGESPRGYLCRVAHELGYTGPLSLAQIAGLRRSGLERDDNAKQIAHVLRLEPEEWLGLCYRHINGHIRFDQRLFYGERISADDLNYKRPRICPLCLRDCPVWWAVWDLGLVTTCPLHRCHLLNQCGLQKEPGLATSGSTPMSLRIRPPHRKTRGGDQRPGSNQCRDVQGGGHLAPTLNST
jgi:hypothetical protein